MSWRWQEASPLPRQDGLTAAAAFDGRYLIDPSRADAGRSLVVIDTANQEVAVKHVVRDYGDGWRTDRAWLVAPWLIVAELNAFDPDAAGSRLYRYDLRSGAGEEVTIKAGFPAPWIVWDIQSSTAVFDTRDAATQTSCIWTFDIDALTWEQQWCEPQGWIVGWLRLGPGLAVTFRSQEGPHDGLEPCVRLYRTSLENDDEPTEIDLQHACQAFSGAGGADWTAWSEVGLHAEDIEYSPGFAVSSASGIRSLGAVETGSLTACGEWVYWQGRAVGPQHETLVRWRPGEHAQVVFEARPGDLMGMQQCDGGWLTITTVVPGQTETIHYADTRQ